MKLAPIFGGLLLLIASTCLAIAAFTSFSVNGGAISPPVNSVLPVISSSSPVVGTPETTTNGTWSGSPTFSYQWKSAGSNVGTNANSYTPVTGDIGNTLTVVVTGTNGGGSANATSSATGPVTGGGGNVAFVPPTGDSIHFMATAANGGSDSNDGLAATVGGGHGPWLTANHAMNCGDPIIAGAGAYSPTTGINPFGTVSNCPSTSGGIDGTGGIQFAIVLCGSTLMSCDVSYNGSASSWPFDVTKNHWAVEGFSTHGFTNGSRGGFVADGSGIAPSTGTIAYVAFVNDIAYNVGIGYGGLDNGTSHDAPGATGFDYYAAVGDIAQNAQQNTVCTAAFGWAGPASIDTNAGTHFLMYGNFSYNQPGANNTSCVALFDIEDYMFDTWDAHGVTNQSVMLNNIGFSAERYGIQLIFGNNNSAAGLHDYIYNNTLYNDNLINTSGNGEINLQMNNAAAPSINVLNNIAQATQTNECGLLWGGSTGPSSLVNVAFGTTGNENVSKAPTSGNYQCIFNGGPAGVNFNQDAAFNNTTDLLANQMGPPSCAGFTNTTACMGWNATTSSLTNPSIIYDLTPTCTHCAAQSVAPGAFATGAGYQLPSTTCISSGFTLYPTWLKGIVYLQWNGTSITENNDLVTKPCGL